MITQGVKGQRLKVQGGLWSLLAPEHGEPFLSSFAHSLPGQEVCRWCAAGSMCGDTFSCKGRGHLHSEKK
jgi:hypothetical protein